MQYCGIEFHVVMALCSTVLLPQSVLDLGTVKRPLVACLVGYVWVDELCQHFLQKTSSDEVNLSSTLSQERLTCILLMLALCVHPRTSCDALSEPFAIFLSPSLWHLTKQLNSRPGATKLGPVGPALLIVLLRRQSSALLWTDFSSPHLSCCCINMFSP